MAEVKKYKKQMNKSFKKGLLYIALSVWFVPGIFFRLISFMPKKTDGIVEQFFQLSYTISPNVLSFQGAFKIVSNEGIGGLLTISNILALIIVIVFLYGCSRIAGAFKQQDKLFELSEQARDEVSTKNDFR